MKREREMARRLMRDRQRREFAQRKRRKHPWAVEPSLVAMYARRRAAAGVRP